jgi:hypothetical protein
MFRPPQLEEHIRAHLIWWYDNVASKDLAIVPSVLTLDIGHVAQDMPLTADRDKSRVTECGSLVFWPKHKSCQTSERLLGS